jgi:ATP-dependent RNA helicase UAP56/SUB2
LIDSDKLTLHGLSQYYINLEENQKTRKLTDLMDILGKDDFRVLSPVYTFTNCCSEFNQVVIFVRDKRRAASLNKILVESKFPSVVLHADMSTDDR